MTNDDPRPDGGSAGSDDPAVPIVCPDCGTDARIPLDDVADKLDAHNDRHHDGEEVATVDPELADQLANLVVDDMGLLEEDEAER